MKGKKQTRGGRASFLTLCLGLFFLGGILIGRTCSFATAEPAGQELTSYLRDYLSLESERSCKTAVSALILYFRYPLLALLLGSSTLGIILLPLASSAFGFSLSFAVNCFAAAFGSSGVLLALAIFGVRCLISLPCFFLMAVPAWANAAALTSFGRCHRAAPVLHGRVLWRRTAFCAAALLVGTGFEWFCSPWLLRLVLEKILI